MIRIDSFMALEASLADRLAVNFEEAVKPVTRRIEAALSAGDYGEASLIANSITVRDAVLASKPFIGWITNLAMLFGASRVTRKPGTSVVGLGYEKLATQQAVDAFAQMLVEAGDAYLQEQALQLIALHRDSLQAVTKAIDTSKLNSYDPKQRILQPFGSFVDSAGKAFFNIASSLHTSRVSAYGFTAEANAIGMEDYQITEQLDSRICPVCEVMHGRVFRVSDARALLGVALRVSSPEDLKYLQPWPSQAAEAVSALKSMSAAEIVQKGWHIPPYHPRCRGLLTRVGKAPSLDQIKSNTVPVEGPYNASTDDFLSLGYPAPTPAQLKRYNASIGLAPAEVVAELRGKPLDVFYQGLLMSEEPKAYSGLDALSINKKRINFTVRGADHGSKTEVRTAATFDTQAKSLQLTALEGGSNSVMKKVLRSLYTLAQDSNQATISVDKKLVVDGYEWARRGFKPTAAGWKSLSHAIKLGLPDAQWYATLSPELKGVLDSIVNSPDPASVYALADLGSIGKRTLSADYWSGYLPIDDSEAVARFLLYLGG